MTQQLKPLRQILVRAQERLSQGEQVLAVFDLDSTLFDVTPRIEKILADFADLPEIQAKYPESARLLKSLRMQRTDWGIKQTLLKAGFDSHHPDFLNSVRDFWKLHFFSNSYLDYDLPYQGAVDFVQKLHEQGCEITYLTGRDVLRMGEGSLRVLKKWGFPVDLPTANLVLKPMAGMDDADFKANWFNELTNDYGKIWFFENEPVNVQAIREAHQHVELVFFDSTHSGLALPPADLPRIMHYLMDD